MAKIYVWVSMWLSITLLHKLLKVSCFIVCVCVCGKAAVTKTKMTKFHHHAQLSWVSSTFLNVPWTTARYPASQVSRRKPPENAIFSYSHVMFRVLYYKERWGLPSKMDALTWNKSLLHKCASTNSHAQISTHNITPNSRLTPVPLSHTITLLPFESDIVHFSIHYVSPLALEKTMYGKMALCRHTAHAQYW